MKTEEITVKEYCQRFNYNSSYVSDEFKTGRWKERKLPSVQSIRKIGYMWMITVEVKEPEAAPATT